MLYGMGWDIEISQICLALLLFCVCAVKIIFSFVLHTILQSYVAGQPQRYPVQQQV